MPPTFVPQTDASNFRPQHRSPSPRRYLLHLDVCRRLVDQCPMAELASSSLISPISRRRPSPPHCTRAPAACLHPRRHALPPLRLRSAAARPSLICPRPRRIRAAPGSPLPSPITPASSGSPPRGSGGSSDVLPRFRHHRGSGCSTSSPTPPRHRILPPRRPPVLLSHYLVNPFIDHAIAPSPARLPVMFPHGLASPDLRCGGGDNAVMALLLPWASRGLAVARPAPLLRLCCRLPRLRPRLLLQFRVCVNGDYGG